MVRVQSDFFGGLRNGNVDLDLALICPWLGRLEVEEGDVVVLRLDTVATSSAGRPCVDCRPVLISLRVWQNVPIGGHLDQ